MASATTSAPPTTRYAGRRSPRSSTGSSCAATAAPWCGPSARSWACRSLRSSRSSPPSRSPSPTVTDAARPYWGGGCRGNGRSVRQGGDRSEVERDGRRLIVQIGGLVLPRRTGCVERPMSGSEPVGAVRELLPEGVQLDLGVATGQQAGGHGGPGAKQAGGIPVTVGSEQVGELFAQRLKGPQLMLAILRRPHVPDRPG